MHDRICQILLKNDVQFLYVTNASVERTAKDLARDMQPFHCEASVNEKNAFELALTCSWAAKRAACLISSEGLYEALDPLMSSAYTGTAGGFIIVAVQENEEEITPIGVFSKLPLLVTEDADEFAQAVRYGYHLSDKYRIPVLIQAKPLERAERLAHGAERTELRTFDLQPETVTQRANNPTTQGTQRPANFVRAPEHWAATPKFRYELHRKLNDKIEKIRQEHEQYSGNKKIIKGDTGLITDKSTLGDFYDEDVSVLKLVTVFPLPINLVSEFVQDMNSVFVAETYPAIELQIPDRSRISKGPAGMLHRGPKPDEMMYGFQVVRDKLGPASSINMAHGIAKLDRSAKILALTYEDFFMHSGMPAFVNTLYNGSNYLLLIMSNKREEEIRRILAGFGFTNCHTIAGMNEVERFKEQQEMTVLFCRGIG